ncbi:histidine kinase [Ahniella affigens]|uniref:histidine kinase n=1 Tax=Ahniella affigens TaxID=2021234 RepID=A0A2P1PTJ0_9GAMM|nr:PAS domain S-box protein [Ahniella affigens]AVP98167.1 histidine kinase [Ahniella affigens]
MSALFDQLFEVVPDAVILVDRRGVIVHANTHASDLFGYSHRDLVGETVDALVPDSVRGRHSLHRADYMERPRVRPMGTRGQALVGRRKDGSEFPVEIALSALETEDGPRYLASIRDISESQRVRQALLRARHDRLVARVGELAVNSTDVDSVLTQLPRDIAEALQIDAVAIASSRSDRNRVHMRASCGLDHIPTSNLDWSLDIGNPFGHVITTGESLTLDDLTASTVEFEQRTLRDSGFRSALFVPLADRDGRREALIALSKQAHSFDQDSRFFLGSVANLLSALIQRRHTEEQLAHSQRLDAIGQLTGGIAHDFNNLLTVVSGNLQLIEISCPDQENVQEMVRGAHRAVDSAAQLTAKLLAFARRQHLSPQWIDTEAMLREMGALLGRTLGETVQINVDASADLPPLFADRAQLESALLNLALNARDAMPRGGQILIKARMLDLEAEDASHFEVAPGRFLTLAVTDTGIGMKPEILEHIFEPFFTTKGPGKGNGLGLSMVYGFVRQSGGHVHVESQVGQGTRIEMLLPLQPDAAKGQTVADLVVSEPVDPLLGTERILVVEDDQDVRAITITFLRSLGYVVNAASTAEQALEMIAEQDDIAVVLSDVVLGSGMSGVELAQALETLKPRLPVLLTSGYEHQTLQQLGVPSGQFEFLRKPYRREQLAMLLRRKLKSDKN